jgi:hypothetical protein
MKLTLSIAALLVAIALVLTVVLYAPPQDVQGSQLQGMDYNATTTGESTAQNVESLLKTGSGSLAQVALMGAATGVMSLYDATTSDASLRDAGQATTSNLIAAFPNSAAANTYMFDATFNRGLLLITDGTAPTSTITWR